MIYLSKKYSCKYIVSFVIFMLNIPLDAQLSNDEIIYDKYLKVEKISERIIIVGSGSNYYTAIIGIKTEPGFDVTNNEDAKRWYKVLDWLLEPDGEIEKIIYGHGLILTKKDLISFNDNIR